MADLAPRLRRAPGWAGRAAAAALALAVLAALALGVAAPAPGLLALAAAAVAGALLTRHRRRGPLDAVLVGVGGGLTALVLTGIVLDVTGAGLRPTSWAVALAALAGLGVLSDLGLSTRAPERAPRASRRPALLVGLRLAPWAVAAVAVLAVALGISVRSLSAADQPPLAMAFGAIHGTDVQVVVTTGEAVGRLELRTSSNGTDVSYPLFRVGTDGTRTTLLSLPRHGRYVVTLNYPDQTQPLRTLILDR